MIEEWRDIVGWPDCQVSNLGNVRMDGIVKKLTTKDNGYLVVGLWNKTTHDRGTFRVNRLVCIAFHGDPPFKGAYVLHKNHQRADNKEDNLYWGTQKRNLQDMVEAGRECRPNAKLDWEKAREIRRLHLEEGIPGSQLGVKFGVNTQTINCLLRGETWKEPS